MKEATREALVRARHKHNETKRLGGTADREFVEAVARLVKEDDEATMSEAAVVMGTTTQNVYRIIKAVKEDEVMTSEEG